MHKSVHLRKNRRESLKSGIKDGFKQLEHEFKFGTFRPEKQDYHFRLSVAPNIFHWKDPKTPAPFTPKPEFTQFVGKWKAPSARGERNGEVTTSP